MPSVVRTAVILLTVSILVGAAFLAGPGESPIAALLTVAIAGVLIVGVAWRGNWARLSLVGCYVASLPLSALLLPAQLIRTPFGAGATISGTPSGTRMRFSMVPSENMRNFESGDQTTN